MANWDWCLWLYAALGAIALVGGWLRAKPDHAHDVFVATPLPPRRHCCGYCQRDHQRDAAANTCHGCGAPRQRDVPPPLPRCPPPPPPERIMR